MIAEMADMVGYSFVQRPGDIARLQEELAAPAPGGHVHDRAKIETRLAVHTARADRAGGGNTASGGDDRPRRPRGRVGYRRLAELQEEILWLCEAAHVPVIWATQVLDRFVRKGIAPRAEITDAAMAERAECVMLNKGPYVARRGPFSTTCSDAWRPTRRRRPRACGRCGRGEERSSDDQAHAR